MKTISSILLTIVIMAGMNNTIFAQCKIDDLGDGVLSTQKALLGDGNSSADFSIMKKDTIYFMKIEYARGFTHDMIIDEKTPLIFVFGDGNNMILYPISNIITDKSFAVKFEYAFIGTKKIVPVYSVTKEQLVILSQNVPDDIKLYFKTDGSAKYKDKLGNYWSLLKFQWHYEKRLIKVLKCAIESM